MPLDADSLKRRIETALPGAVVVVQDTTGTGDHWEATVVSPAFAEKGAVERHRLVYAALGDWMKREIHALALTTLAPQEAQREAREAAK